VADMGALLYAVAGTVIGGLITYAVSRYYYQQASKDLRQEALDLRRETREVRHYVNVLISCLESAGQIKVTRDAEGRPIEVQILKGGGIRTQVSMGGGTLVQSPPPGTETTEGSRQE
jgi:hypothetical protein